VHNKELGFILKRFLPAKQKLSILTQNFGKAEIITNPPDKSFILWPGMLISFHASQSIKNMYIANNVEILLSPTENNSCYLHWIHQTLEICYYFLPLQDPCEEVFNHLYHCIALPKNECLFNNQISVIKKIYLLKLLLLMGFYPDKNLISLLSIYEQLTCTSIDIDNKQKVESIKIALQRVSSLQIKKIDNWVLSCINSHPCFKNFKTVCIKNKT